MQFLNTINTRVKAMALNLRKYFEKLKSFLQGLQICLYINLNL